MADNKGNPYHDKEGKFTSGANKASGEDYEAKIKKQLGIREEEPSWKQAGYDEPVVESGIASAYIERNGETQKVRFTITSDMLKSFLTEKGVDLENNEELKQLIEDNTVVPNAILEEIGVSEDELEEELGNYLLENDIVSVDDLEELY